MKLIIDIPEENYNNKTLVDYFGCYSKMLDATIYNGTPATTVDDVLEQIRAEIEHEGAMFPDGEFFVSIDRINEIIDKYRKEQTDAT